jgi:hypothetical protein
MTITLVKTEILSLPTFSASEAEGDAELSLAPLGLQMRHLNGARCERGM